MSVIIIKERTPTVTITYRVVDQKMLESDNSRVRTKSTIRIFIHL